MISSTSGGRAGSCRFSSAHPGGGQLGRSAFAFSIEASTAPETGRLSALRSRCASSPAPAAHSARPRGPQRSFSARVSKSTSTRTTVGQHRQPGRPGDATVLVANVSGVASGQGSLLQPRSADDGHPVTPAGSGAHRGDAHLGPGGERDEEEHTADGADKVMEPRCSALLRLAGGRCRSRRSGHVVLVG